MEMTNEAERAKKLETLRQNTEEMVEMRKEGIRITEEELRRLNEETRKGEEQAKQTIARVVTECKDPEGYFLDRAKAFINDPKHSELRRSLGVAMYARANYPESDESIFMHGKLDGRDISEDMNDLFYEIEHEGNRLKEGVGEQTKARKGPVSAKKEGGGDDPGKRSRFACKSGEKRGKKGGVPESPSQSLSHPQ